MWPGLQLEQLELAPELESDLQDTDDWLTGVACLFQRWKNSAGFLLTGLSTWVILIWKWIVLFFRKNHPFRCWGWVSLLNLIGALPLSLAEIASKNIGALIHSMKFLFPEVTLYLYKSTTWLYMKYCCHIWMVLLAATWNCKISYKNRYVGLLVLHLLSLLNPWLIVKM